MTDVRDVARERNNLVRSTSRSSAGKCRGYSAIVIRSRRRISRNLYNRRHPRGVAAMAGAVAVAATLRRRRSAVPKWKRTDSTRPRWNGPPRLPRNSNDPVRRYSLFVNFSRECNSTRNYVSEVSEVRIDAHTRRRDTSRARMMTQLSR